MNAFKVRVVGMLPPRLACRRFTALCASWRVQSKLPLAEALPLLQKYDPNGNHKVCCPLTCVEIRVSLAAPLRTVGPSPVQMIVPSPIHEAKIKSLTEERTLLLRAIDALLDVSTCSSCSEHRGAAAKDVVMLLRPFEV